MITRKKLTKAAQMFHDEMEKKEIDVQNKDCILFYKSGYYRALDHMCRFFGANLYEISDDEKGQ